MICNYGGKMSESRDNQNIQRAIGHLHAALALLERTRPTKVRREEWFKPSGHSSKKGLARLNWLLGFGWSAYAAAKDMGISYRTAARRRKRRNQVLPRRIVL
jgi:hypothetical protein